jgi:hypothetical protein
MEDLEEVSSMKSVPNWISYLHEFFWNFSQLITISFELFSFGNIFNSGIICHGVSPISLSLSPHRARLSACRLYVAPHVVAVLPRTRAHAIKAPTDSVVSTAPSPVSALPPLPCPKPTVAARLAAVPTGCV